jgi:hypothetical protein
MQGVESDIVAMILQVANTFKALFSYTKTEYFLFAPLVGTEQLPGGMNHVANILWFATIRPVIIAASRHLKTRGERVVKADVFFRAIPVADSHLESLSLASQDK